ncbi:MAG: sulfatase-like hydrolase/transferase [Candidatus Hydrogenedentales bacterium]
MQSFLKAAMLACTVLLAACFSESVEVSTQGKENGQRHVVLFILDTLRAEVMSSYSYPLETSPELDALAAEGVRFEYVVAPCSWTRPSVGAMLTGRYPRTLGLYDEAGEILADRFDTLPELLRENGYATIGLTANPVVNSVFNMHQGFDTYIDSHVVFSWMGAGEGEITARDRKLISAPDLFRRAEQLVDEVEGESIYLQFSLMEMHEYWRAQHHLIRDEFLDAFPQEENTRRRRYLQSLRQLSHDVDAFIERLQQRPGWRDALFVIVSDHGEGLDSHPAVQKSDHHGRLLYASHVHVPWILYSAELPVLAQTVARPVRLLDLTPTLLDLLGVASPAGLDGVSLAPLLNGDEVELPSYFVTETHFRNYEKIAAYSSDWVYIDNRDPHNGVPRFELQALERAANGAKTNALETHGQQVEQIREYLAQWEAAHPRVPATTAEEALSEDEREQMKSIGYLE